MTIITEDLKALEVLIVNNPDLQRLEDLIAEFNIFEALGAVHHEIRHSDFLAFLLDPNANHGLGDRFLKRFLLQILTNAPEKSAITPIDIDLMSMENATVSREWQHIDILIDDPDNRFICLIENKVLSDEHSNQLSRYLTTVSHYFPERRLLPIFLTPDGHAPSEEAYLAMNYDAVAQVIETTLQVDELVLGPAVLMLMAHYATMLRRHIVSDSEIAELCQKIYRRHQRALDLIFEHRPDMQLEIAQYLANLVNHHEQLILDHEFKVLYRILSARME